MFFLKLGHAHQKYSHVNQNEKQVSHLDADAQLCSVHCKTYTNASALRSKSNTTTKKPTTYIGLAE
jgi:hypothetical protein